MKGSAMVRSFGVMVLCVACAVGSSVVYGQAAPIPPAPSDVTHWLSPDAFSALSGTGALAAFLWYLTTKAIPAMLASHADAMKEKDSLHLAAAKDTRDTFAQTVERIERAHTAQINLLARGEIGEMGS